MIIVRHAQGLILRAVTVMKFDVDPTKFYGQADTGIEDSAARVWYKPLKGFGPHFLT